IRRGSAHARLEPDPRRRRRDAGLYGDRRGGGRRRPAAGRVADGATGAADRAQPPAGAASRLPADPDRLHRRRAAAAAGAAAPARLRPSNVFATTYVVMTQTTRKA